MHLQEKIYFFLAIFPTSTTVDKLCLFLTWERTVGEGHFCSLHDLKLLLAGRCPSCWDGRVFSHHSISSAQCLDYHGLRSALLHHPMQSVKYCNGGERCLPCNLLILVMKRNCLYYRTGFNCVLLPQGLHHSTYLLCRSDSFWEERPCCQWSSVELGGYSLPASGAIRLAARAEAAFPDVPWLAFEIPESS